MKARLEMQCAAITPSESTPISEITRQFTQ
jgi:hypothetical protein